MQKEVADDPRLAILEEELRSSLEKNRSLEKENEQLKQELVHLKTQLNSIKARNSDSTRSALWSKLQISVVNGGSNNTDAMQHKSKVLIDLGENPTTENLCSGRVSLESIGRKERQPRVPKPPPRPTCTTTLLPDGVHGNKAPPPPPPPPPPPSSNSKLLSRSTTALRRVPEVMEFYRSLTRSDARTDNRGNVAGIQEAVNAKKMIGEIENRSAYLLAIKSDVETQMEFIMFLTREVENAVYTKISDLEEFVKWLDEELSYLVDERAVLKHFPQWPERKADAMREAAFSYRDLKNLESEVLSFLNSHKQAITLTLKRIQALQDRLEGSVHNIGRIRESTSKKYREFQIPWDWMLDDGMIRQLKLCSLRLAKEYMKRVTNEMKISEASREDLMLQAARFAFRVHQFAGGFDVETRHAFEELRQEGCRKQQDTDGTTHSC
ncbi:PREDICTED: protein CHUP1, chloroplastic [Nelumbo nucifera]|uniref:Protein CHUP1, chloroplastic n=2 Tax=Nelumbo nucifera TaxID=4432 RepID=A0A1U7ZPM2_NELNU|nr:PREDICTED: protein CHUP1, chloroplastic [Nelumbo nucifera]DAD26277.1 TPA_asm: hypothetical protein HUJ06_027745 [Nelumbo nucifera]